MTSPNANLLRGLLDFVDGDGGPDAFASALFEHPVIGPLIPFNFEAIRDYLAEQEDTYREIVRTMTGGLADGMAEAMKKNLRR